MKKVTALFLFRAAHPFPAGLPCSDGAVCGARLLAPKASALTLQIKNAPTVTPLK